jgi:hypothetical protein
MPVDAQAVGAVEEISKRLLANVRVMWGAGDSEEELERCCDAEDDINRRWVDLGAVLAEADPLGDLFLLPVFLSFLGSRLLITLIRLSLIPLDRVTRWPWVGRPVLWFADSLSSTAELLVCLETLCALPFVWVWIWLRR